MVELLYSCREKMYVEKLIGISLISAFSKINVLDFFLLNLRQVYYFVIFLLAPLQHRPVAFFFEKIAKLYANIRTYVYVYSIWHKFN